MSLKVELTQQNLITLESPFELAEHAFKGTAVYLKKQAIKRRLSLVDMLWRLGPAEFVFTGDDIVTYRAELTIAGVSRWGLGGSIIQRKDAEGRDLEGYNLARNVLKAHKEAVTDILPRAALNFGVGAYLRDMPKDIKNPDRLKQHLADLKAKAEQPPAPVIQYDANLVIAHTKHLFNPGNHQQNALRNMVKDGIILPGMSTDAAVAAVITHQTARNAEKTQPKPAAAQDAPNPADMPLQPFQDGTARQRFVIACHDRLGLNPERILHALVQIVGILDRLEDYEGTKESAWAAAVAFAADYDVANVNRYIDALEAPNVYRMVLEIIDTAKRPWLE